MKHTFTVEVETNGNRKSAELDLLIAWAGIEPDGCSFTVLSCPQNAETSTHQKCDCRGLGTLQEDESWICGSCGSRKAREECEQLRIPDSPSVSTGLSGLTSEPQCTCGFDSEGWRTYRDEIAKEGDEANSTVGWVPVRRIGRTPLCSMDYRTSRPKANCPACNVKKEAVSEIAEFDLGEVLDSISQAFQKIAAEINRIREGK